MGSPKKHMPAAVSTVSLLAVVLSLKIQWCVLLQAICMWYKPTNVEVSDTCRTIRTVTDLYALKQTICWYATHLEHRLDGILLVYLVVAEVET